MELSTWGSLMDSLQLMRLCFLLLTVAPHSDVAMPSASHAERTPDSSTGTTTVTVYLCRGCKHSGCDQQSYAGYEKIIHTEKKTFQSEELHLETSEEWVRLCYQCPTPEGVLAIFWKKPNGMGNACGTLNSEASSGNVTDGITETCCEAEMNIEKSNHYLKCYTKVAHSKVIKSSTDISDEESNLAENAQPVIDEQSSRSAIVTTSVLLTVVVCGVALAVYCVRQRRNGREPVIIYQFFSGQEAIQK